MPRGGSRPGAGRPKKNEVPVAAEAAGGKKYKRRAPPVVDAEGFKSPESPASWPFGKERPPEPAPAPPPAAEKPELSSLMPLDYLLEVMRNEEVPPPIRMQAATLAAPYVHAKPAPKTAKQEAEAERKKNAQTGRFSRRQAPVLTAVQGGKS